MRTHICYLLLFKVLANLPVCSWKYTIHLGSLPHNRQEGIFLNRKAPILWRMVLSCNAEVTGTGVLVGICGILWCCRWLEHAVGITVPIFWGQGIIIPFGFLPKRSAINTVVGAPIPVPRYSLLLLFVDCTTRNAFASSVYSCWRMCSAIY